MNVCKWLWVSYLTQVIEVVLPTDPFVFSLQTLWFIGDISSVKAFTMIKLPLKELSKKKKNLHLDNINTTELTEFL